MRDDITLWRRLSLAGRKTRISNVHDMKTISPKVIRAETLALYIKQNDFVSYKLESGVNTDHFVDGRNVMIY